IGRYTVVGALAGLLIGAAEGMYRYRYPIPPIVLKPDVAYVILFLGPLLDALAGGFFGLLTGLFVACRSSRIWRPILLILGVCLVALLVLMMAKNPEGTALLLLGAYPTPYRLAMRAGILLAGSGAFIVGRFLPLRTLSFVLAGALVISLGGVGVYVIEPSMHRASVTTLSAGPTGKPNIILITLDAVRADHLSLYGYPRQTTPSIDKWARKGVVFENAIAPTSWTLPSHASMFTGLLPHQHGADKDEPLDPRWWTISEVLSSRGYETAGFTSNFGWCLRGWGLGNGFELYDDDATSVRDNLVNLFLGRVLLQRLYGDYVDPQEMQRRDAGQINRDVLHWFHHRSPRPFYLFINYYDAHGPYIVPDFAASPFGPVSPWHLVSIQEGQAFEESPVHLSAEDREAFINGYDNCLAFLDSSVGELLNSLSRLPGWENTIVIITSDHGEGFGEHGKYFHAHSLYRELLHVPLIILGPGIPAGRRISHVVRTQELFETVLQLSGMENPPFQRASLQRFWEPGFEPGDLDEFVISELSPAMESPPPISMTTPEWQYLRDAQGSEELYHWVSDPGERFNLAKSPENQKLLQSLQIQLRAAVSTSLRPWRRPEYLSALGGFDRTAANAAGGGPALNASSTRPPRIPIGTSQAFFPRRAFASPQRPPSTDEELLRSLPYH
ncbi:MAG: sulfatase, partial [Terriglobia bacterium]